MLVEDEGSRLGWTATMRHGTHDVVLQLKYAAVLPLNLLWMSNGGRDTKPWNGRHTGVLGMEEARCYSSRGHAAAVADNPLRQAGVPTTFELGDEVEIRQVLGGVPLPSSWTEIVAVEPGPDGLHIADVSGAALSLGYDAGFLFPAAD